MQSETESKYIFVIIFKRISKNLMWKNENYYNGRERTRKVWIDCVKNAYEESEFRYMVQLIDMGEYKMSRQIVK